MNGHLFTQFGWYSNMLSQQVRNFTIYTEFIQDRARSKMYKGWPLSTGPWLLINLGHQNKPGDLKCSVEASALARANHAAWFDR